MSHQRRPIEEQPTADVAREARRLLAFDAQMPMQIEARRIGTVRTAFATVAALADAWRSTAGSRRQRRRQHWPLGTLQMVLGYVALNAASFQRQH